MKTLGNILWLLFGGVFIALEYFFASIILFVTIIGIPFGIQTMKLAGLALWPFGKEVILKEKASGCFTTFMNLGAKMGSKMCNYVFHKNLSKWHPIAKKLPKGSGGLPLSAKGKPKGVKMGLHGLQN